MPNTVLTGTTIAAVSKRQLDRRDRVRIGEAAGIDAPTLSQRLDQHGAERREQQQPRNADGNQDQRDARRRARASAHVRAIFDDVRGAGHQRPAAT